MDDVSLSIRDVVLVGIGGLVGFLASVAASIVFSVGMRVLRPKIDISTHIARDGETHKIKLVNRRSRDAINVAVHVFIERQIIMPGAGTNLFLTPVETKFRLDIVPGRTRKTRKEGSARFARIVRLDDEFRAIWAREGEGFPVLVRVFARDEISGVGRTFEVHYGDPRINIIEGYFEQGDSTSVARFGS